MKGTGVSGNPASKDFSSRGKVDYRQKWGRLKMTKSIIYRYSIFKEKTYKLIFKVLSGDRLLSPNFYLYYYFI